MDVSTIGLDLAKNVFQVHGVDRDGKVIIRRQVRRNKLLSFFANLAPCMVGTEACCSAHYWAREIQRLGHEVRLMPPHYVKPYVKRQKNDATDAEAICEAVTRPTMRFVAIKGTEQQSVLVLHRTRSLLIRQRTMLVNALRSHFAEFGIVVANSMISRDILKCRQGFLVNRRGWGDRALRSSLVTLTRPSEPLFSVVKAPRRNRPCAP